VETSLTDSIENLPRNYNFIFRRAPMEKAGHVCQKILEDTCTAVLAPSLASTMTLKHPEDLAKSVLLHMKSRPEAWRRWLQASSVEPPVLLPGPYYEHFFLSLQAAISGLGVAIAPLCFVTDDLSAGRLVAPFPDHLLKGPGFHVLYQPGL